LPAVLDQLQAIARSLPPSQRPMRWLDCPELMATATGKWDPVRWRAWLAAQLDGPT
jgi:o-succinylbenzoate---CoA ligase